MKRWVFTWISVMLWIGSGFPQETLESFQKETENYYHFLAAPGIDNFSCKISSGIYINFIKDKGDSSYFYPLKFIWTKKGSGYYVLQSLPAMSDSLRRETLTRAQALKNLFADISFDLQNFYLKSPSSQIPPGAQMSFSTDTVGVSFSLTENEKQIFIKETYSRAGQLRRIIWKMGEQKVITYPVFQEVQGKWICAGWRSQIYRGDQITRGMGIQVEYATKEEKFLPIRLDILAQSQETPDQKIATGGYVLFLKDFMFNEDITELTPQASDSTSQQ